MTAAGEVSSYKLIEELLLRFVDSRIRELIGQDKEAEKVAIEEAGFTNRQVKGLDGLQHKDLCHLLIKNTRRDGREGRCVLLKKHHVRIAFSADVRYVKDLRDKYAHPTAARLPSIEQLSDLIVIERVVQELSSHDGELSKDLLRRVDVEIKRQLRQAAPALAPEQYDVEVGTDAFPSSWKEEIRATVSASIARSLGSAGAGDAASGGTNHVTAALAAMGGRLDAASAVLDEIRDHQKLLTSHHTEIDSRLALIQSMGEHLNEAIAVALVTPEVRSQDDGQLVEPTDQGGEMEDWAEPEWEEAEGMPYDSPLSVKEARDLLIGLRRRMWDELGQGPSTDGLLRKRMLDTLLKFRPLNDRDLEAAIPAYDLHRVPSDQRAYLPQVYEIIRRIHG